MENLNLACIQYIRAALGLQMRIEPWQGEKPLPLYLHEQYSVYQAVLLDRPVLFMADRGHEERSPGQVRQQMETGRAGWTGDVVYVRASITAYNRSRLISQRVSFIVPGSQLYLPTFGVALREHFKEVSAEPDTLSPSAQALLLMLLYSRAEVPVTPKAIAEHLGYTAMSMTRAFSELKVFGIGEHARRGKYRELRLFEPRKQAWERAQPYMRSPVKRRLYVSQGDSTKGLPLSGMSALAEHSMVSPPARAVYACSDETWRSGRLAPDTIPLPGPEDCEVEVWSYSPTLFQQHGTADPLSLYLSFRRTEDERVEQAIRQMMEKIEW